MKLTLKDVFDMYESSTYIYLWTQGWNMRGFKQEVYNAVVRHHEMWNSDFLSKKVFSYNFKSGCVSDADVTGDVDILSVYMYDIPTLNK